MYLIVNNIKIQVIHNSLDLLFAKYRILDAMGTLYKEFELSFKEEYKRDKIRAYVDMDNDNILDVEDQCDTSSSSRVNIYGCENITCIKVEELDFSKIIKEDTVEIDTGELKDLWNLE